MVNNSGFTSYDEEYEYLADDAEALVYMVFEKGGFNKSALYVMRRVEAQAFCERPETCGKGRGGGWCYAFTTHHRDWRNNIDGNFFRKDDGRFDGLLKELGIVPIFRGGDTIAPVVKAFEKKPVKAAQAPPQHEQLRFAI